MSDHLPVLPEGTVLANDYRIGRVLGSGGFGITYLAQDRSLNRPVAIKEYFPQDFATRGDGDDVRSRSEDCSKDYHWGLQRFISEAQTLARFNHQNIVRVHRYIEANNTAYMVLTFEQGESFKGWLMRIGRAPRQGELDAMLAPLLDALALVHQHGMLHRDIAPDNILIRRDGAPVLIDFGSARGEIAHHSKTVSAIVKPGYSPFEQYAATNRNQGPWTDIYSLAATLYHAVTGERPIDSPTRMVQDDLAPASTRARGAYRAEFLAAIDLGLRSGTDERPQSVSAWRDQLLAGVTPQALHTSDLTSPAASEITGGATQLVQKADDVPLPRFAQKTRRDARARRMDMLVEPPAGEPGRPPSLEPDVSSEVFPLSPSVLDARSKRDEVKAVIDGELARPGLGARILQLFSKGGHAQRRAQRPAQQPAKTPAPALDRANSLDATPPGAFAATPTVTDGPNSIEVLAKQDPLATKTVVAEARAENRRPERLMDLLAKAEPAETLVLGNDDVIKTFGQKATLPAKPRARFRLAMPSLTPLKAKAAAIIAPIKDKAAKRAALRKQKRDRKIILQHANVSITSDAAPVKDAGKPVAATKPSMLALVRSKLSLPKMPKWRLRRPSFRLPRLRIPTPGWQAYAMCAIALAVATGFVVYEDRLKSFAPKLGGTAWTTKISPAKPPEPQTFSAHEGQVTALVITQDGRHLISGGADRRLRVWNAYDGALLRTMNVHAASINALATDGDRVVSADASGTVLVWKLETGEIVHRVKHHDGLVWSVAFAPDGRGFASAGQDGKIKVWGGDGSGEPSSTLDHSGAVLALAYLDRNGRLLSAGADKRVRMWEPGREKVVRTYRGHKDQVVTLAVTPDQRRFASGGLDKQVRIWSTRSRKLLRRLAGHDGRITATKFTPDGRYLLTGSSDQTVKIWSMKRRKALRTLTGLNTQVSTLAVTPDGRAVIAGGENGSIRIWPINARRNSSEPRTKAVPQPQPGPLRELKNQMTSLINRFGLR